MRKLAAALSLLLPISVSANPLSQAVLRFESGETDFRFQRVHHLEGMRSEIQRMEDARAHLIEEVERSIVTVVMSAPPPSSPSGPSAEELERLPPAVKEFFGSPSPRPERGPSSTGSGAILSIGTGGQRRKVVVTNNHVIDGKVGAEVTIILDSGAKRPGVVLDANEPYDVAFVAFKDHCPDAACPALKLGDSSKVKKGHQVFAFGSPLGLQGTVTMGIVSNARRDIGAGLVYDFVQTDASMNKGNSGGPLVNWSNEIVGINTAIISPSGGSVGLGMATPSNHVAMLAERFVRSGTIAPARIGAGVEVADGGIRLKNISEDSPAYRGGLRDGDVVIQADEAMGFTRVEDFMLVISRKTPNVDKVRITVRRGGQELIYDVLVGAVPPQQPKRRAP